MLAIKLMALVLVCVSSIHTATVEDLDEAKLLFVKNILNNYVVEGTDIVVKYGVYNIGSQ